MALLGYSVGEYAAAALAGVLRLEDALRVVARRAAWIEEYAQRGGLLAVPLPAEEVRPRLGAHTWISAVNGPQATIVGGRQQALDALAEAYAREEIATRAVEAEHGYHTPLLAAVGPRLTALVQTLARQGPQIPLLSNVTGTWWTAREVEDAGYWAAHMCEPVQFAAGVEALLKTSEAMVLEVGPGAGLSALVRQHPDCPRERMGRVLTSLPAAWSKTPERTHVA